MRLTDCGFFCNISIISLFFIFYQPACGEIIKITSVEIKPFATRDNLVPNFSFEEIKNENHLPIGWIWDKRNTNAVFELDDSKAHTGRYSVKFTNNSPFGIDIYATLRTEQPIRLIPGKTYTLSAYVLSLDPGVAGIEGGHNWNVCLSVPPTEGKWRRIWLTFTPSKEDEYFTLHIHTESPTNGFWVDDIKLEEGNEPTPCFYTISNFEIEPMWNERKTIFGDGEFVLPYQVSSPKEISAQLSIKIGDFSLFLESFRIPAGVSCLIVKGEASGVKGFRKVHLNFAKGGTIIMNSDTTVCFISSSSLNSRLEKLESCLPRVKKDIEELRRKKEDISYQMVTYTVLENFVRYTKEDLAYYEKNKDELVLKRAEFAIKDMEKMLKRLTEQLKLAKEGKLHFPKVPRWTGKERPKVVGYSFIAPTVFPGSTPVRRPVFFTGYGAFDQVKEDIEKFPNYGTNIIFIEFGPVDIFPNENEISDRVIKEYLQILDRGSKVGVAVTLLLSPHYFPDWMLKKYPHLKKKRDGFLQYCLHAPESKELLLQYVRAIIPPLKDHPALHSICLTNEPVNIEEPCEYALKEWHIWLKNKHGDIATLNERWGTTYVSFDEIPLLNPFSPDFTLRTPLGMDYVLFNQEFFAGWHKMLADAIREIAPDLPVHAKAMTWTLTGDGEVRCGVDAELFAEFSQINGNDSVNFYSHGQGEFAQGWLGNLMPYDLQRSMKIMPIYNSENHIIPDRETRYIPPEHIRCALWQEAIYGQGATAIWIWERTYAHKSDAAGSIMHRPLCAEAVGIVNNDLNRLAEYVTELQKIKPQVTIIMSNSAKVWDNGPYSDCLDKLYIALTFCGIRIGFVTERQLERGELPSTPLLFVPNMEHISDKAFESLKKYQGKIIMIGHDDLLKSNEYDKPRKERIKGEIINYRYGETSWQDIWLKLLAKLRGWGIRPFVEVVGINNKPVWGVAWLSTETKEGVLVNICNYRKDKVEIKLKGKGKTAIDLISEEQISLDSISLSPLEYKLILLK